MGSGSRFRGRDPGPQAIANKVRARPRPRAPERKKVETDGEVEDQRERLFFGQKQQRNGRKVVADAYRFGHDPIAVEVPILATHHPVSLLQNTYCFVCSAEKCAEDGQCSTMFKSYESLIKGEGCRSFYFTGKCSRICTYSLKSLIGRHTWAKCAERCEWSKALTDGISSWLDMCLANPAPDVFEPDDDDKTANVSSKGRLQLTMPNGISFESSATAGTFMHRLVVGTMLLLVLSVVVCAVAVRWIPAWKKYLNSGTRLVIGWVRRLRGRPFHGKTESGKGPLDIMPSRKELRSLQRGTRRHLKAMRALD